MNKVITQLLVLAAASKLNFHKKFWGPDSPYCLGLTRPLGGPVSPYIIGRIGPPSWGSRSLTGGPDSPFSLGIRRPPEKGGPVSPSAPLNHSSILTRYFPS